MSVPTAGWHIATESCSSFCGSGNCLEDRIRAVNSETIVTDVMASIGLECKSYNENTGAALGSIYDDCAFSWHPGGAMFVFADGSVHFLPYEIDLLTYQNLGDRNDGQVIDTVGF